MDARAKFLEWGWSALALIGTATVTSTWYGHYMVGDEALGRSPLPFVFPVPYILALVRGVYCVAEARGDVSAGGWWAFPIRHLAAFAVLIAVYAGTTFVLTGERYFEYKLIQGFFPACACALAPFLALTAKLGARGETSVKPPLRPWAYWGIAAGPHCLAAGADFAWSSRAYSLPGFLDDVFPLNVQRMFIGYLGMLLPLLTFAEGLALYRGQWRTWCALVVAGGLGWEMFLCAF